jgi:hypothetical protein
MRIIRAQDLCVPFRFAEQKGKGAFKTVYAEMVIKTRRQKIDLFWFSGRIRKKCQKRVHIYFHAP